MQGWNIFTHSVRMVFGNLGPALRVSGLLYLAYMAVNAYFQLTYAEDLAVLQRNLQMGHMPAKLPSGLFGVMVLNFVVALLTSLWISVLWHRYVLLAENPDTIIPTLNLGAVGAYLGKTIQLALILVIIGGALGMLMGVAIGPLLGASAALIIQMLLIGVLLYLSYRLGLVMPAAALSKSLAFKTSWEKTAVASGAIAQLAVIAVVFAIIIQIPSNMNPDVTSIVNLVYTYVVGWIAMMVGVSVLTTLYGIYIEGRDL